MENQPETNLPAVTVEVTGLQSIDGNDATTQTESQPEIVVIENNTTIEQTPESATAWQERIEGTLAANLATHQNQTLQMMEIIQSLRETMTQILDCQIRTEAALTQLIQQPQSNQATETQQQETETVPVQKATEPAAAQPQTEETKEKSTRKKRRRI